MRVESVPICLSETQNIPVFMPVRVSDGSEPEGEGKKDKRKEECQKRGRQEGRNCERRKGGNVACGRQGREEDTGEEGVGRVDGD